MADKTILVISNDRELISILSFFFKDYTQVITGSGAARILENNTETKLAWGFLDLDIIEMGTDNRTDSLRLLEHIKEKNSAVPIIVVSSCLAQKVIKCALRLGAADYIIKPLKVDRLVSWLNVIKTD